MMRVRLVFFSHSEHVKASRLMSHWVKLFIWLNCLDQRSLKVKLPKENWCHLKCSLLKSLNLPNYCCGHGIGQGEVLLLKSCHFYIDSNCDVNTLRLDVI